MPSKKFKTEYGSIPCKSGEDDDNNEDEEAVPVPVFKIFIKAHFQIANPKKGDCASFKFKKAPSCQKITVKTDKFGCMHDIYSAVRDMSFRDVKSGDYDVDKPAPIRQLSYLAQSSEWLMNPEELKSFPPEFLNLTSDKAMEIAVCNRLKSTVSEKIVIKHDEKGRDSSSSSNHMKAETVGGRLVECVDDDDSSVELITVKFDADNLILKFEFDNGKKRLMTFVTRSQIIFLTKSTVKYVQ